MRELLGVSELKTIAEIRLAIYSIQCMKKKPMPIKGLEEMHSLKRLSEII